MKIELLSPAGSYEALKAAINAGADAVYLGGQMFGARAYANNLSNEDLLHAIDYTHLYGKKLYLTLNTLLKDNEINNSLYDYLSPLYHQGLDAVIVQDMGVINFVKRNFPDLPIHGSTQMCVTGVDGAKVLQETGLTRVVTARELSLEEIRLIKENTTIEIESFIHGALCYCYSGQCLLSSMLGGRSGNRGRCAQPCRLPYQVLHNEKLISKEQEQYILSPKDMCTIEILPEIVKSGVYSLKIEGRMKSSEYCAGVTSIYRMYIDKLLKNGASNYHVNKNDIKNLLNIYNRSGTTKGYYLQHNAKEMITLNKPGYVSNNDEFIEEIKEKFINKNTHIKLTCQINLIKNEPILITVNHNDISISVKGNIPLEAVNKPLSKEMVMKQISKTGGSPFQFEEIQINLDDGIFITVQDLNQLRRTAIENITIELLKQYKREKHISKENLNSNIKNTAQDDIKLNCMVDQLDQFYLLLEKKEVSTLYVNYECMDLYNVEIYAQAAHHKNKKLYLALPQIFRHNAVELFNKCIDKINQSTLDGFLIRNIDEYGYFSKKSTKEMIFDHSMYTMNNEAKSKYLDMGANYLTIPLELNFRELKNRGCARDELIVYGYLPLMVSAGCVKKTLNNCNHKTEVIQLNDRYNKRFMVKNSCNLCYNTIYNSQPLSLLGVYEQIKELNVFSIRLNFTIEEPKQINSIIESFINVFIRGNHEYNEIENFTRGHFKRGVE